MCTIVDRKLKAKTKHGYKVVIQQLQPRSYYNAFTWLPRKTMTAKKYTWQKWQNQKDEKTLYKHDEAHDGYFHTYANVEDAKDFLNQRRHHPLVIIRVKLLAPIYSGKQDGTLFPQLISKKAYWDGKFVNADTTKEK